MKRRIRRISLILTFLMFISSNSSIFAMANSDNDMASELVNHIVVEENMVINDSYEVYGNTDMSDKEFRDLVNRGDNKIYLHYRTDKDIDLPYDALLKIKTSAKTYSFEYLEMEDTQADIICSGIQDFLRNYSGVINAVHSEQDVASTIAMASEVPTTFISCVVQKEFVMRFGNKGYIIYNIAVSRYTVDSESILYIVTVNSSFVPGIVAKNNDEDGYANFKNQEGYVHMTVEQAYDATQEYEYGIRWGNIPYKKDYWPINGPNKVAITSTIQTGVTFGFSFENGFSLDDVSVGLNFSRGANIAYEYSKTIEKEEPAVTVQTNSSNLAKCEWYYEYAENASETYHQQTNYMFEMSNSRNGMFIGDFRLKLDYKFVVHRDFWPTTSENVGSVDLIVRAGEYNDIYDFADGMV